MSTVESIWDQTMLMFTLDIAVSMAVQPLVAECTKPPCFLWRSCIVFTAVMTGRACLPKSRLQGRGAELHLKGYSAWEVTSHQYDGSFHTSCSLSSLNLSPSLLLFHSFSHPQQANSENLCRSCVLVPIFSSELGSAAQGTTVLLALDAVSLAAWAKTNPPSDPCRWNSPYCSIQ